MFTDNEMEAIVQLLMESLNEDKAGKADNREMLARKQATKVREFLKGRYNAGNDQEKNKSGIVQLRDVLTDEDIGRR